MQPDPLDSTRAAQLRTRLASVAWRLSTRQILAGGAIGSVCATLVATALIRGGQSDAIAAVVSCVALTVAVLIAWVRGRRTRTYAAAAATIERRVSGCHNVVISGEELLRAPDRSTSWIRTRVYRDALERIGNMRAAEVVPLRGAGSACVLALVVLLAVLLRLDRPVAQLIRETGGRTDPGEVFQTAGALAITAIVEPPPYVGRAPVTIDNPDRIEALQGSRVRLRVRGPAVRVRYADRPLAVQSDGTARHVDLVLKDAGYFAVDPVTGGATRLIVVTMLPDRAPTIRIEAPGRDLLLPDASKSVPIRAMATDDYGLRNLEIRYTRVSGSGEQFEFTEGTLPIALARDGERAWKGTGVLALPALELAPGDSLVYRAVARDARPGDAGLSSSETFFVEIAGPGQVALSGFEMPPDRERHALSQQMIVLKIERLRARERTMTRDALQEQTAAIAAEQRAVRANFVFLMGGHVEDEEEEAEHSHEIQEGRLKNDARAEMAAAIGHMTRAEQALTAVQTGAALPPAKAAVEALQRAFGRNRYLLRTLPVRSRIDPARRLSGELTAAGDWRRVLQPATPDAATRDARAFLARLLALASAFTPGAQTVPAAETFNALAESALVMGASDPGWQQIARDLLQIRDRLAQGRSSDELAPGVTKIVTAALVRVRRGASSVPPDPAGGALRAAWAEGYRR